MKRKGRKIIALILALVMSSSVVMAGCNSTKESATQNWSQSADDYASMKVNVSKKDGKYTVKMSSDDDMFSEAISKKEILLNAYYTDTEAQEATSDESTDNSSKEELVQNFDFTRDSASELTVTFESDKNFTSILAGVDKTATTNGKYGDGMWSEEQEITETVAEAEQEAEVPSGASVLADSYNFDDGELSFKVQLGGMTFEADKDELLKAISSDDLELKVKEVNEDNATLTVDVDAKDLDSAVEEVGGKTFTIKSSALSDDEDVEVVFADIAAQVNFDVETVEENKDNGYDATAKLFTLYGDFEDLSKDDLTFGGDFKGAEVTELKESDAGYDVSFTFSKPYDDFSLEDFSLNGTLSVEDGKIKNEWGTNGENSCDFTFTSTELDKNKVENIADVISSSLHFISSKEDYINKIGALIGVSPYTTMGIKGVKIALKVAGLLGIKEISGESAGYTTDSRVADIQAQMKEVDSKISKLNDMVSTSFGDISTKLDQNTYSNVCYYWNDYTSTYVGGLQKVMSSFKNSYNSATIKSILSPSDNTIKLYIDNNGDVCIPGLTEKYSSDGVKIKSIVTCKFDEDFAEHLADIMLNTSKTSLIKNSADQLNQAVSDYVDSGKAVLVDADTNKVPDSIKDYPADALFTAITGSFALSAINNVGAENIVDAYTAFCYRLGGGSNTSASTATGKTYLDYFYQMITLYYNFYSEAESDINTTKAWLATIADQAYPIAVLAQTYCSTDETTIATATESFESTISKKAPGEDVELPKANYKDLVYGQYSYVIDDIFRVNIGYEAYGSGATIYIAHSYENDGIKLGDTNISSLVNAETIKIIYNRYLNLKKAGITNAASFKDYLVDALPYYKEYSERYSSYIITSNAVKSDFPLNNTVKLKCIHNYVYHLNGHDLGGDYFKEYYESGKECYIGDGNKINSKYFTKHLKFSSTLFNMNNGEIKTDDILLFARYKESHFYWRGEENASFASSPYGSNFIYFTKG